MSPAAPWNIIGTDEILAPLEPLAWLVEGLRIGPGAPTLCAGYGYSGKSIATAALALSVASGLELWERFVTRRGEVLHLDYEQGARLTCHRYQRMCAQYGLRAQDFGGRLKVGVLPSVPITTVDDLLFLGDDRALVVVDSWRAAHSGIDENSSDVRTTLDRATLASERTGCTFLFLHHSRKPREDSAGGSRMSIRGSSGFYDGCQTVYVFDGSVAGHPTFQIEKDRLSGAEPKPWRLDITDTLNGAGLRIRAEEVETESPPDGGGEMDPVELIRQRLSMEGEVPSATVLAKELHCRKSTVLAALQTLDGSGEVETVRDGKFVKYRSTRQ